MDITAIILFTQQVLIIIDYLDYDCYYFKRNLKLSMYIKVLLVKSIILFFSVLNMKKELSLMSLILCLSGILLAALLSVKCFQKYGYWEKRYKGGIAI